MNKPNKPTKGVFALKRELSLLVLLSMAFLVLLSFRKEHGFSFIMMGDSRTELCIPYGKAEVGKIDDLMAKRYWDEPKLFFNANQKLDSIYLFKNDSLQQVLIYNQEKFPEEIFSIIEGERRRVFCKQGMEWVYGSIVGNINNGQSDFVVHGGDMVLFGYPDSTFSGSPYWQYFNESFYSKLPDRVFYPVVGNHETWDDMTISGMREAFPYLESYGFTEEERIYTRDYKGSRFVFLNTGPYVPETAWNSTNPDYSSQMNYLKQQLDDALAKKIKNVFVTYHYPSFVKVGHPPLPPDQNPHNLLKQYSNKLNVVVFNSHTHTTEHYFVDNINYLVMGAGGAPQKYEPVKGGSTEPELYWKGKPRFEEYNYIKIEVSKNRIVGKIHRYAPEFDNEMEWVEVFTIDV